MLEIVFSDSACGSLKAVQRQGDGEYHPGCISVIITHADGSKPSKSEIKAAQQEAEDSYRLAWEKAVPVGGSAKDVYGFSLSLSIGDISEDIPAEKRSKVLEWLYSVYPDYYDDDDCDDDNDCNDGGPQAVFETLHKSAFNKISKRISAGEDMRIWYSDNPDELCGLYWFMSWLSQFDKPHGQVYLIKLPEWMADEDENITQKHSCDALDVGDWSGYLSLQKAAPKGLIEAYSSSWKKLQAENAPLRAVINGQLVSVSKSFYDDFIRREIEKEAAVFDEAMIIGRVLGNYRLQIGDAWVALRIEEMIRTGMLEAVTEADKDMPIYHRKLRKLSSKCNERM